MEQTTQSDRSLPLVLNSMPTALFVEQSQISNKTASCPPFAQQNVIYREEDEGRLVDGKNRISELRKAFRTNPLLMEYLGLVSIADARANADGAKGREATISELTPSLLLLPRQLLYEGGCIATQTIVACCVAGAGEHSRDTSLASRAASLGVRSDVLAEA